MLTADLGSAVPYLSIRGLGKTFDNFVALQDIELDISEGEFVCFLGPSGCGKTTLLRAIAGIELQSAGSIHQGGRDISNLPVGERDFGIVFQSYALFPNLSAYANVAYGLRSRHRSRREIDARVAELLALVGLAGHAQRYPAQLSGGQQQRVALARALALAPGLLLLDEPLSALDARVRVRLRSEIRDLQRRLSVTTIMVTHDQEEALCMADRIVVMNQGRIEQVGTPTEIYLRPTTPFVADFVGQMNFFHGNLVAPDRVRVAGTELTCSTTDRGDGCPITLCVRPEDVAVRDVADGAPNVLEARVETMEFAGNHFVAALRAANGHLTLAAHFSINDVRDLGIISGGLIRVNLPPERLHIFPPG